VALGAEDLVEGVDALAASVSDQSAGEFAVNASVAPRRVSFADGARLVRDAPGANAGDSKSRPSRSSVRRLRLDRRRAGI
jgi:hypothetical protein